jgi:hypothetical protein
VPEEIELPPIPEVEDVSEGEEHEHTHEESQPLGIQASVWRIGPAGLLLNSVFESQAAWLAEQEPNTIIFYADLDSSAALVTTDETMQKVYTALSNQGLAEGQIINAVNAMRDAGIYFSEAAN